MDKDVKEVLVFKKTKYIPDFLGEKKIQFIEKNPERDHSDSVLEQYRAKKIPGAEKQAVLKHGF